VLARLARVPVAWETQVGCSWDVATRYPDESIDFVFLDASHAYESISRDIDAWRPKVKRGGLLAGHDYVHWTNPEFGVVRAVNERFPRFEVWPGVTDGGDAQMQGHHFPCWCVRV
jgi:predicted O-methyltransferase YrrM